VLAVRNEFWNRYKSQSTHHIDSLIEQEQKVIKKAVEVYMNFKRGKGMIKTDELFKQTNYLNRRII
jgi:hypothetical protein